MKRLRILPGAASIIALTATMGFVDGQRETDSERALREQVTEARVLAYLPGTVGLSTPLPEDSSTYMIAIKHGGHSKIVLIDAVTGSVLKA
jgi:hypothetical protein